MGALNGSLILVLPGLGGKGGGGAGLATVSGSSKSSNSRAGGVGSGGRLLSGCCDEGTFLGRLCCCNCCF